PRPTLFPYTTLFRSSAMSAFARSTNRGRALLAAFVSAAFLWALALSVSPQLHQRVHKDANRVEHSCAATMIASGSYNHAAHVPLDRKSTRLNSSHRT